jgi:hypothetical protein
MKMTFINKTILSACTLGISLSAQGQVSPATTSSKGGAGYSYGAPMIPEPVSNGRWGTQSRPGYPTTPYNRSREHTPPPMIYASTPDVKEIDAMEEDLNVMSLLLERQLERILGQNAPSYKMGIPMLLKSGTRGVQSMYLEGFGVVLTLHVNFPLNSPPSKTVVEEPSGKTDWDAVRNELYGRSALGAANRDPNVVELPTYNAEQVDALKNALLESLRNAKNIRHLKADEAVVITVTGTESIAVRPTSETLAAELGRDPSADFRSQLSAREQTLQRAHFTGRGTALTIRAKKSDVDAFAKGTLNLEDFRSKAAVYTYLGAATQDGTFYYKSSSYGGGGGGSLSLPAAR